MIVLLISLPEPSFSHLIGSRSLQAGVFISGVSIKVVVPPLPQPMEAQRIPEPFDTKQKVSNPKP